MKTYVINLPRATDRRAQMERQLAGSGLDYEFVDGVDGAALTPEDRAELVDEAAVGRYPWWSTPGMIGTALSHKRVYDLIVARQEPRVLVLEDDARLQPGIGHLADAMAAEMQPNEVLLLNFRSHSSEPCKLARAGAVSVGEHSIMRCANPEQLVSSSAYLVDLEAARRLSGFVTPVKCAPDIWSEFLDEGVLRSVRCVFPRPVTHDLAQPSYRAPEVAVSLRQKLTHLPIWPLPQLRAFKRARIQRQRLGVELV